MRFIAFTKYLAVAGLVLVFATGTGFAQTDAPVPLFSAHEPLIFELKADFGALKASKEGQGRRWLRGEIIVAGENPVPVSVAIRGRFRVEQIRCRVPMLWLRFDAADTADSVLSGQGDIPLTTQCTGSTRSKNNVLQEYLAYRIYDELSSHGLNSRLATVTYTDARNSKKIFDGPAFFVEHFDRFALRIGAQIPDIERFDPRTVPPGIMATHDLFQFLIANTDWSAVYQHNVLLVKLGNGNIVPVPFDFDWSGLVNAKYAYPDETLKIRSVRTRLYRGLCYDDATYTAVKAEFIKSRPLINALVDELPGLGDRERISTKSYVDDYYEILGNPKTFARKIVKKCRAFDKF
jgi:hypothetical protein